MQSAEWATGDETVQSGDCFLTRYSSPYAILVWGMVHMENSHVDVYDVRHLQTAVKLQKGLSEV